MKRQTLKKKGILEDESDTDGKVNRVTDGIRRQNKQTAGRRKY